MEYENKDILIIEGGNEIILPGKVPETMPLLAIVKYSRKSYFKWSIVHVLTGRLLFDSFKTRNQAMMFLELLLAEVGEKKDYFIFKVNMIYEDLNEEICSTFEKYHKRCFEDLSVEKNS